MNSERLTASAEFCTVGERTWFHEDSVRKRHKHLRWQLRSISPRLDWHQPIRCDYLNTSHQVAMCSISHIMKTHCNVTW